MAATDPRVAAAYANLTLEGRVRVKSTGDLDLELCAPREQSVEKAAFEKVARERLEENRLFWAEPNS